jgi:hypothetical protein
LFVQPDRFPLDRETISAQRFVEHG